MCQFSRKTDDFDFLGPSLPQDGFWDRNFKNLSPNSESTSPNYHVCQFSVKMNNFEFFGLNLGKKMLSKKFSKSEKKKDEERKFSLLTYLTCPADVRTDWDS